MTPSARRAALLLLLSPPVVAVTVVAGAAPAARAQAYAAPKAGSKERKAILDALRVPVQKVLKRPVQFRVTHLRVLNGWAFVRAMPQRPDGRPLDYRGTPYQEADENGAFSGEAATLLRRRNGRWAVVAHNFGHMDVIWDGWDRKYGAPRAIFP